ncbi:unnamed protein product [Dicrocoelium dendriticum]|nr:unnamed protein product [Dicrocoelium dendriticum]
MTATSNQYGISSGLNLHNDSRKLFREYYLTWGGEESLSSDTEEQLPDFFHRVPQDHEVLPQKLREEARASLLESKSHDVLESEELQALWFLLDKYQSPPDINGEKFISYENFRKAASEADPKAR